MTFTTFRPRSFMTAFKATRLFACFMLVSMLLAPGALLAVEFNQVQPVGDERCLARTAGGFGLEDCQTTQINFVDNGQISLGLECVSAPISSGHGEDSFENGRRLQAVMCSSTQSNLAQWRYDSASQVIRAVARPEKCLSIRANPGSLRAVALDCTDGFITHWDVGVE